MYNQHDGYIEKPVTPTTVEIPRLYGKRAKITPPRGSKKSDLSRCPTCGGLVLIPCALCRMEGRRE